MTVTCACDGAAAIRGASVASSQMSAISARLASSIASSAQVTQNPSAPITANAEPIFKARAVQSTPPPVDRQGCPTTAQSRIQAPRTIAVRRKAIMRQAVGASIRSRMALSA